MWGPKVPANRNPRVLGLFAHPDDEVFCVGGTIARCVEAGADTAIVSLTRGEAGQIRDPAAATRRTLGSVRESELSQAARALGVREATCLDLGDGRLADQGPDELAATVRAIIEAFAPDVVVTFGPDGAFGHPDHVTSCLATVQAVGSIAEPPRLLHARFPRREQLLLDVIVEWLKSDDLGFNGSARFGRALRLFADGSSMLGLAADHIDLEWFPAGSFIVEQGERPSGLYCILSGSVDVVVEGEDGRLRRRGRLGAGGFIGADLHASGRPVQEHAIARDDVTCLVLAPHGPSRWAGRGEAGAVAPVPAASDERPLPRAAGSPDADSALSFEIDVRPAVARKVAALVAHRSQYAMEPDLFPSSILERLLGVEYFTVAGIGAL